MEKGSLLPRVVRRGYSTFCSVIFDPPPFPWSNFFFGEIERLKFLLITSSHMPQCPQYTASKYGVIGFCRASGPEFLKENITVNAICPAFIPTNLCPPEILKLWPKEHITPLSTVNKAIDAFLADDSLTGQAVELSQENIYFRKQVEYPNESQKWVGEKSNEIWDVGYQAPPKREGY